MTIEGNGLMQIEMIEVVNMFIGVAMVVAGGVIYSGLLRLADALKNRNPQ
ncbi:MAG: hypothetical protein ACXAEE_04795 [Candidatus Thorarchaeota archaeon]